MVLLDLWQHTCVMKGTNWWATMETMRGGANAMENGLEVMLPVKVLSLVGLYKTMLNTCTS